MPSASRPETVVVVGLGYVGLPLAVALSKFAECWGLDVDKERIAELKQGRDQTGELSEDALADSTLRLVHEPSDCPPADYYIVTVPTPVDAHNVPDLSIVIEATKTVAKMLQSGRQSIIVYESTVYPGVTEDICGPELERGSGLECGRDFFLAYSPERINPGDRRHTVDRITKVVSGQNAEVLERVANLYAQVTTGGVYRAASIKTAEAAKVIENAQRDINIAFVNEITKIFGGMGLSVWDVLDAANTKWNFLPFSPGLVGGHCIGVDPYYLSYAATAAGVNPQVILAGRQTNDRMGQWVAEAALRDFEPKTTLVLGLTFKENVPDLRNSKVVDMIGELAKVSTVTVHDPLASESEAKREYGLTLETDAFRGQYDLIVLAVPHDEYISNVDGLAALAKDAGRFFDLKRALPVLRGILGSRYLTL